MFWTLVKKESLLHLKDYRFTVCCLLNLSLLVTSLLVLKADYAAKEADYVVNTSMYYDMALQTTNLNNLDIDGVRVERPPVKLQVAVHGVEKNLDLNAKVGSRRSAPMFVRTETINPVIPLFPTADLLFVVSVVLTLLAFVMSYDSLCGERENGTLKLLMSYHVPRDRLILAKWLAGYIALITPFLATLLIEAIIIVLSSDLHFTGQDWWFFAMLGGVSILYLAAMYSLGLFVSVAAKRTDTSIVILILIWILFVIIVPDAAPVIADQMRTLKSTSIVKNESWEIQGEMHRTFHTADRKIREQIITPDLPEAERIKRTTERENAHTQAHEEMVRVEEEMFNELRRAQFQQAMLAENLSRISPVACFAYVAADLAGTGLRKQFRLADEINTYHRDLRKYTLDKIFKTADRSTASPGVYVQQGTPDVSDLPRFQYVGEPPAARFREAAPSIIIISVYGILFFALAFLAFVRAELL